MASYNRALRDELKTLSAPHADVLMSQGTSLGWWHDVVYGRNIGRTPQEVAGWIARKPLPRG